jgi:hypothetical protein
MISSGVVYVFPHTPQQLAASQKCDAAPAANHHTFFEYNPKNI